MSDNHTLMHQQALAKPPPATDGWDDAAAEAAERTIRGQLLKFADWRWTVGKEATPIQDGTKLVALATSAMWVRWEDGKPEEYRMREPGRRLPDREELGYDDESQWRAPTASRKIRGETPGWHLVDPQTAEAYTFSTSSWGGRGAVTISVIRSYDARGSSRCRADRRAAVGRDADQVRSQIEAAIQNRELENGRRHTSGAGRATDHGAASGAGSRRA